ncbi:MAG: winged helix-turn-helix domain-containing protein [Elusimicrobia bacterium]|nr:winged helix-turn-helix domain-containing protein [Elusimicrobiota bacterium]
MGQSIEEIAEKIRLILNSEGATETTHLKLKLELSASKLFLALGWMLKEGKVEMEASEYGYKVRLAKEQLTRASN